MAVSVERIRNRLMQEQYQKFVVADIGNFPWCINKTPEGTASLDRYKKYSSSPLSRTPPFNQWGAPQITSPSKAEGFIRFTKNRNASKGFKLDEGGEKLPVRVSECSNFAYHSAGVLLDDPAIRKEFDVAIVGCMYNEKTGQYQHNITLLIPKGTVLPVNLVSLPSGTLIVDPWAVGMGYPPNSALAVNKDNFAYKNYLFPATVNYQSSLDETLNETATGTLQPYSGEAIYKDTEKSQLAETNTPSSTNVLPLDRGEPVLIESNESYAEYNQLWLNAFNEILQDPKFESIRGNTEQKKIHAIRTVLDDYTKGGDTWWSAIKRFFTGHWNRHHVSEVDNIVKRIDNNEYKDSASIISDLDKIDITKKTNPVGDFKQQLEFIREKDKEEHSDEIRRQGPT